MVREIGRGGGGDINQTLLLLLELQDRKQEREQNMAQMLQQQQLASEEAGQKRKDTRLATLLQVMGGFEEDDPRRKAIQTEVDSLLGISVGVPGEAGEAGRGAEGPRKKFSLRTLRKEPTPEFAARQQQLAEQYPELGTLQTGGFEGGEFQPGGFTPSPLTEEGRPRVVAGARGVEQRTAEKEMLVPLIQKMRRLGLSPKDIVGEFEKQGLPKETIDDVKFLADIGVENIALPPAAQAGLGPEGFRVPLGTMEELPR